MTVVPDVGAVRRDDAWNEQLVLDLVAGRPAALGLTAALLIAIGVLWIGVPTWIRRR
jgi:hypothetical protein